MTSVTLGAQRVRLSFNPSGNDVVDQIKRQAADFIDFVKTIDPPIDPDKDAGDPLDDHIIAEFRRLQSLAATEIESAAMWAVKAATLE
jgi:hypothetical protein